MHLNYDRYKIAGSSPNLSAARCRLIPVPILILLLGGVAFGSLPPAEPKSPARNGLTRSSAIEEDSDLLFSSGVQGDESSKGKVQSLRVEEQPTTLIRKNSLDRKIERNQSDPIANSAVRIKSLRLGILGTATAGTGFVLKDYYDRIWWEGQPQKFHFKNDFGALRLTDKLGHAYVALLLTELYTPLFRWSGFSPENARWGGVSTSLLHQIIFVEVQDGFSYWGFSLSDAAADIVGAFYPLLQDRSSLLNHFNWKWSYHPSTHGWQDYFNMRTLVNDLYENAFHMDYNGMTFWLSADLHPLLPQSIKPYWPNFLNLALGYSTEEMDIQKNGSGYSELFLALDYDLRKLPGEGRFWKGAKEVLNMLHFPAPALRITPDAVFYILYF